MADGIHRSQHLLIVRMPNTYSFALSVTTSNEAASSQYKLNPKLFDRLFLLEADICGDIDRCLPKEY
jgi:hypothetical protein